MTHRQYKLNGSRVTETRTLRSAEDKLLFASNGNRRGKNPRLLRSSLWLPPCYSAAFAGAAGLGGPKRFTLSRVNIPGRCASSILRQSFGQASTHTLQTTHLSLLSSHDRSTLLTVMAFDGHRFSHMLQKMQVLILISPSDPRVPFIAGLFSYGYIRVAGFETTFFKTFPKKSNMFILLPFRAAYARINR
jgi:hypothetical protein